MTTQKYIAVAGNIGSGKSTLVQFLVQQYNVKPFYEPNDQNPYLAQFYQDMKTWAFRSQLFFLTHKLFGAIFGAIFGYFLYDRNQRANAGISGEQAGLL